MSSFRYESAITKEVHILGKDYLCREPTLEDQIKYEKGLKSKNSEELIDHALDFIASLGVPREATINLPKAKLLGLLSYISNGEEISKKK